MIKILVTSECPTCHKPHTRLEYLDMPWGCMALTMCKECEKENSNENGELVIALTRKI